MEDLKFKKGDIVDFVGKVHFTSPNGKVFFTIKPGVAKITAVAANSKHPYHLVATDDSESTVNGWVAAEDIKGEHSFTKLKVVSFANHNQVKMCFAQDAGVDGITIKTSTWRPLGWLAVCRAKDANSAEQIAHMAEIGCAKQFFEGVNATATTIVDICLEAAGLPINEAVSKSALVNSGIFNSFTSDAYTMKSDYLRRGDILLGATISAVVLSNGKKSSEQAETSNPVEEKENKALIGKGIGFGTAKEDIKVQSGANEKFAAIGEVKAGAGVEVLAIDINGWFRIVWPASSLGYAFVDGSKFDYKTKEAKKAEIEAVYASERPAEEDKELAGSYKALTPLYIRDGAGVKTPALARLPKGIIARCYGFFTQVDNVKWLYVQVKHKNTVYNGFVSSNCLIDN